MTKVRSKLEAIQKKFDRELTRLQQIDKDNQIRFSTATTGGGKSTSITKQQLELMTEALFLFAFRSMERFIHDVFLKCCTGTITTAGKKVSSFLIPLNSSHAEQLIQSAMPFLDWSTPETVISRAEVYLKNGFPIKLPYATSTETLADLKKLRNHITHASKESFEGYKKVLRKHYTVIPLIIPTPGEYLLLPNRADSSKYNLIYYIDYMRSLSKLIT